MNYFFISLHFSRLQTHESIEYCGRKIDHFGSRASNEPSSQLTWTI